MSAYHRYRADGASAARQLLVGHLMTYMVRTVNMHHITAYTK